MGRDVHLKWHINKVYFFYIVLFLFYFFYFILLPEGIRGQCLCLDGNILPTFHHCLRPSLSLKWIYQIHFIESMGIQMNTHGFVTAGFCFFIYNMRFFFYLLWVRYIAELKHKIKHMAQAFLFKLPNAKRYHNNYKIQFNATFN